MKLLMTAINNKQEYKDRLWVLLQSMYENSPDTDYLIAHVFNCSEKYIQECKIINPKVKIVPQRYDEKKDRIGTNFNDNGKSYFMEDYRFGVFYEWMTYHREGAIGWIDADVIIRKPIDGLFDNVNPNTFKIWKRTTVDNPDTQMNIGVMVFGVSEENRNMIADQMELNQSNRYWGHSQKAMWIAWQKHQSTVEHQQLDPLLWNCRTFEEASHIWHPTVNCLDELKYQNEYNRLLDCVKQKIEKSRPKIKLM